MTHKTAARIIVVDPEHADRRIDNFLASHLKDVPKSLIYKIIRTGEVRINGGRARAKQRLQVTDRVRIPPLFVADTDVPFVTTRTLREVEEAILFEDDRLLILNKPSGYAVHAGSGLRFGMIDVLRQLRPQVSRVDLVHRLDRETSGCLVFTKEHTALRELNRKLKNGEFTKTYLALLKGQPRQKHTVITTPLGKSIGADGEKRMVADAEGVSSKTTISCLRRLGPATFVEVSIATGRTHQIRVHAQSIGHPVAGDDRYGDAQFNQRMREFHLDRLFLHAHQLRFTLDREIVVEAPLPPELQTVIERLATAANELKPNSTAS